MGSMPGIPIAICGRKWEQDCQRNANIMYSHQHGQPAVAIFLSLLSKSLEAVPDSPNHNLCIARRHTRTMAHGPALRYNRYQFSLEYGPTGY